MRVMNCEYEHIDLSTFKARGGFYTEGRPISRGEVLRQNFVGLINRWNLSFKAINNPTLC